MQTQEYKTLRGQMYERRCKEEIFNARAECAVKTGLTFDQVVKLQSDGYGISEIMAGEAKGKYFIPKTLIQVVPHFTLLA